MPATGSRANVRAVEFSSGLSIDASGLRPAELSWSDSGEVAVTTQKAGVKGTLSLTGLAPKGTTFTVGNFVAGQLTQTFTVDPGPSSPGTVVTVAWVASGAAELVASLDGASPVGTVLLHSSLARRGSASFLVPAGSSVRVVLTADVADPAVSVSAWSSAVGPDISASPFNLAFAP